MRRSFLSLVLAMFLVAGAPMAADEDHPISGCPDQVSVELAIDFLRDLDMAPNVVPCPRRVDDLHLARLYFEGSGSGPKKAVVAALYVKSTGEILVDAKMNFEDPVDLSYFVHELVHTRQMELTETAACVGVLEAEAYAIQAAYLRERNLSREALLFDLMGQLQAGCASRY